MGQLLVKIYIKYGSGLPSTPQPMRYVREPDAITVAWRVTTRIRSFTRVTLILRWMGLGLG